MDQDKIWTRGNEQAFDQQHFTSVITSLITQYAHKWTDSGEEQ